MGTFGGMARIRSGYWMGIRTWLLKESVDIPKRVRYIKKEIKRIGKITVIYKAEEINGQIITTEERMGFQVTPGSSLEKLLKAYIITGGNPLDLSMFMYPETTQYDINGSPSEDKDNFFKIQQYPYDGMVSPVNRQNVESSEYKKSDLDVQGDSYSFGNDAGGNLNISKYQPPRLGQGSRLVWTADHTVSSAIMHDLRNWCNQEIAEKLHLLEHKIIKLCDLEEQLRNEITLLTKAFGASIGELRPYYNQANYKETRSGSLPIVDEETGDTVDWFFDKNLVNWLIADMDRVFFFHADDPNENATLGLEDIDVNVIWAYSDVETENVLDFCL